MAGRRARGGEGGGPQTGTLASVSRSRSPSDVGRSDPAGLHTRIRISHQDRDFTPGSDLVSVSLSYCRRFYGGVGRTLVLNPLPAPRPCKALKGRLDGGDWRAAGGGIRPTHVLHFTPESDGPL